MLGRVRIRRAGGGFTPTPPEGNFYRFMSISGWSLLPIYRLRNRIFSTGALRAPPGKPPQHNTPPPHPRLAPLPPHLPALPPAHPSHVVFHRVEVDGGVLYAVAVRCSPALRHPAQPRPPRASREDSPVHSTSSSSGAAGLWSSMARPWLWLSMALVVHFYHFTWILQKQFCTYARKSGQLLPVP